LTKDVSTSLREPLDFLSAALKLSKENCLDFCQPFRNPSYSTGLLVIALLEEELEPLNCDASYAQKLGPLDEVSQGHSVLEEKKTIAQK
jgi:hypothetical protein